MIYFFNHTLNNFLLYSLLISVLGFSKSELQTRKNVFYVFISLILGIVLALIFKANLYFISFFIFTIIFATLIAKKNYYLSSFLIILIPAYKSLNFKIDYLNTEIILQLFAIFFALLFCLSLALIFYFILKDINKKNLNKFLIFILSFLILIPLLGELCEILLKLDILELNKKIISFSAKSSGQFKFFNYYAALIILLITFYLGFLNRNLKANYLNQSELIKKRKHLALFIKNKNLLLSSFLAFFIILTSQLAWQFWASKPLKLSPATAVFLDKNGEISLDIQKVKDGKLHRFLWINEEGKKIRFFVINRATKDNPSIAVVFDACMLCGDKGYAMKGNQVICLACGVRLYIPSIGTAGGCNPIPIENWRQENGKIQIPSKSLNVGINFFSGK